MTQDTEFTDVIFRLLEGQVIALFPGLCGDYDINTCLSYQHVGQHGAASLGLLKNRATRPAKPDQYAPLLRELEQLGYKPRVVRDETTTHRRARLRVLERRK